MMDKFLHHFIRVSDKFLHHFLGWFIVPGFADPGFARGDGLGDGWGDGRGDGRGDGQLSHPPDPNIGLLYVVLVVVAATSAVVL